MSENSTETAYERPNPTTVTEALQETKAVLQRQGRTQGRYFVDGKVCLHAAVTVAVGDVGPRGEELLPYESPRGMLRYSAWLALDAVAQDIHSTDAMTYNDLPSTTDEDVYALIDAAIAAQPTA